MTGNRECPVSMRQPDQDSSTDASRRHCDNRYSRHHGVVGILVGETNRSCATAATSAVVEHTLLAR